MALAARAMRHKARVVGLIYLLSLSTFAIQNIKKIYLGLFIPSLTNRTKYFLLNLYLFYYITIALCFH